MRYFLDISYKGTHYAGWQRQPNAVTVQEVLEKALSTFLRTDITVLGAGRTDAGVHARQLIVHLDYEGQLDRSIFSGLNGILPDDISLNDICTPTQPDLHARFDAISRAYIYQVLRRKDPEYHDFAHWEKQRLSLPAMEEAANSLMEYEDFASFCKTGGNNKHTLCQMQEVFWEEANDHLLCFHIRANRFLRGMVRGIVGTLLDVGRGNLSPEDFRKIVEAKDRTKAGANIAAKGLFLTEVRYPDASMVPMKR